MLREGRQWQYVTVPDPSILKLKEVPRVIRMDAGCADGVWIVFVLSPFGQRIEWDGVIVLHNVFLREI